MTAIELYYNDEVEYPEKIYPYIESSEHIIMSVTPVSATIVNGVCAGQEEYDYTRDDDGQNYKLIYCLEADYGTSASSGFHTATNASITDRTDKPVKRETKYKTCSAK
jgi:hypothetical protein